jgi:hypothetical protein
MRIVWSGQVAAFTAADDKISDPASKPRRDNSMMPPQLSSILARRLPERIRRLS